MRLADFSEAVATDLHRLRSNTNEKFFLVSKELAELKKVQDEMFSIHNHNWKIIDEQLDTFANNIHILRNCYRLLIFRQQVNFNYDSFSSLLSFAYANIKTYRAAFYAFRMNLITAVRTLLKKHLPMSLVPKDSLKKILRVVAEEQVQSADRLSLAIPVSEILSYYEAELLSDTITIKEGLLMTLSIPLASRQTAFTV